MDTSGNRQDIILKISEEEERIIQRKNKELAEKEKETREEIHRLSEQTKNTPLYTETSEDKPFRRILKKIWEEVWEILVMAGLAGILIIIYVLVR